MTKENTRTADQTPGDDNGVRSESKYPGMPRWVKMFGITFIGLILLIVAVLLATTVLGLHTPPIRHGP